MWTLDIDGAKCGFVISGNPIVAIKPLSANCLPGSPQTVLILFQNVPSRFGAKRNPHSGLQLSPQRLRALGRSCPHGDARHHRAAHEQALYQGQRRPEGMRSLFPGVFPATPRQRSHEARLCVFQDLAPFESHCGRRRGAMFWFLPSYRMWGRLPLVDFARHFLPHLSSCSQDLKRLPGMTPMVFPRMAQGAPWSLSNSHLGCNDSHYGFNISGAQVAHILRNMCSSHRFLQSFAFLCPASSLCPFPLLTEHPSWEERLLSQPQPGSPGPDCQGLHLPSLHAL